MNGPAMDPVWRTERLSEARAVIADVAHHSDHLIRLACKVLIQHGEAEAEREDARRLLIILDARRTARSHQNGTDEPEVRR